MATTASIAPFTLAFDVFVLLDLIIMFFLVRNLLFLLLPQVSVPLATEATVPEEEWEEEEGTTGGPGLLRGTGRTTGMTGIGGTAGSWL